MRLAWLLTELLGIWAQDCQKFDQQALLQTRSPGKVLAPDVSGKRGTGIVILADENFRTKFHPQIEAVQCYARRQGYDLWLLNGTEFLECQRFLNSFFFLKHCAVAGLLEQQSPEYSVAVIDGDVVPVVLNRSLDAWMEGGDLAFYERVLGEEVMAGNYIAKNKPWVRKFLRTWASMMDRQPPGFSSADNGALHLVLLEALEVSGKEKVAALYSNLTETVDNLDPYWHFVKEAVRALGPPRKWNLDQTSLGREHHCSGCRLSIWPRMSFFADDGVYLNRQSSSVGPVMHHGIKSHEDVAAYYEDTASCHLRGGVQVQKEQLGQVALSLAAPRLHRASATRSKIAGVLAASAHPIHSLRPTLVAPSHPESYTDLYLQGDCAQCAGHCVANFTCRPLDMDICRQLHLPTAGYGHLTRQYIASRRLDDPTILQQLVPQVSLRNRQFRMWSNKILEAFDKLQLEGGSREEPRLMRMSRVLDKCKMMQLFGAHHWLGRQVESIPPEKAALPQAPEKNCPINRKQKEGEYWICVDLFGVRFVTADSQPGQSFSRGFLFNEETLERVYCCKAKGNIVQIVVKTVDPENPQAGRVNQTITMVCPAAVDVAFCAHTVQESCTIHGQGSDGLKVSMIDLVSPARESRAAHSRRRALRGRNQSADPRTACEHRLASPRMI
ncbi:unnamed protein product [Effrenium voratum]|nr:unnamed protein product [Effrenium voratum]